MDIIGSGDNDDAVDDPRESKDILPKASIFIDSSAANIYNMFNRCLFSSLSLSTQLYCEKTGLPFVKSLFNQLQLTNEKSKFTSTKVVGIIFI